MTRPPDWREQLTQFVRASETVPFRFGASDCCIWAADALQRVTGCDVMGSFRVSYSDEHGAGELLKRGGGLARLVTQTAAAQGWAAIEPRAAVTGDLGVIPTDQGPAAAVCFGWQWLAKSRAEGLVSQVLRDGLFAWRVA